MANYCGQCAFLNTNKTGYYNNEYWCNNKRTGKKPTDKACENFTPDPKKMNNSGGGFKPSGCLATFVCSILGLADDCIVLNKLRELRKFYLRNVHPELLVEYDNYSPIICEKLLKSETRFERSIVIMNNYLTPCAELIQNKKYEEATKKYLAMINYSKYVFAIPEIPEEELVEAPIELLGHARILKKIEN